jgi:AbrB family looped-hinge helix DNA binding protein
VKLNSKGQVTIPADLRQKFGFLPGDEVEVIEDRDTLRIVHRSPGGSTGERVVERMRGAAPKGGPSTDDLMELLRGD